MWGMRQSGGYATRLIAHVPAFWTQLRTTDTSHCPCCCQACPFSLPSSPNTDRWAEALDNFHRRTAIPCGCGCVCMLAFDLVQPRQQSPGPVQVLCARTGYVGMHGRFVDRDQTGQRLMALVDNQATILTECYAPGPHEMSVYTDGCHCCSVVSMTEFAKSAV